VVGVRNYLVEGVSGTGKTAVCTELTQRGYRAIHGDRELAYRGDPETGRPVDDGGHEHHLWDVERVRALVADQDDSVTFFCGGSRNSSSYLDLFEETFILEVDLETLLHRLDQRPDDEFGSTPAERELVVRLHQTGEGLPSAGIVVDATRPLADVVDEILRLTGQVVVLETERLRLRPWRVSEAAVQRELWTERDPRVPARRRVDADGHPTVADIEEWIRAAQPSSLALPAVERKAEGDVIGYCGLIDSGRGSGGEPELAFELLRRVWGNGYATEASWAVLEWARSAGIERVSATVWDWNSASRRVLAKLGFVETERRELDAVHGTNLLTTKRL
jgi:[ribosomal protein S5]-alanine N-acetyltransferase